MVGKGAKWLHEATLPLLTWAYSSAYYKVDSAILECTIGLQGPEVHRCFACHSNQVVSPTARPLKQGQGRMLSVQKREVSMCVRWRGSD